MTLENFRAVNLKIDRANGSFLSDQFAKAGDYNGRRLVVQLSNAGVVGDLTGVDVNLGWQHDTLKNTGLDPFEPVDLAQGIFEIYYPKEMLNEGSVTAVIQIIEGDHVTETKNFKIKVEKSVIDEDTAVSENSFTVLEKALLTVNRYDSRISNVENSKVDKSTFEQSTNNLTAQLQQTEKQVGKNPADFGALGNGIQDDTLFIQNMIDTIYQESTQNAGYVFTGFSEEVKFPVGDYLISNTINIPQAYPNIDFSGSRFRPHPNALNDFFAFNFTAIWNGSFKNIVLDGFKKHIKMYNNNQDSGHIKIDNVSLYGGDVGYDIDCQSSKVTITNFKFNRVKKPIISKRCDKLTLSHGWHDAGVLDTIYDGMYEISNATQLIIDDMLYVPRPQTIEARKIFVVKLIGGSVLIKNSLFGGEPGQIPIVGVIGGSLTGRGNRVSIQDTLTYTSSSALVELFNIPNYVEFSGVTGGLEATNEAMMIRLNTDLVSYADAVLQADPESKIVFGRNYQSLPFSSASSNLLPFIVGVNNTRFNKVVATNLIGAEVLFDSKRNSKNAFVFRRGAIYKLSISNRANPTVESFSQFLIQSNFGGENATIKTLIQGANTTAPKAVVEDGVVKIYTNGAVTENNFYYKLEIVDAPVFPFHH